jgi:hypothetical protein
MSVYVDKARWRYGRMLMCHMIASTDKELHTMAGKLGLKRDYFHEGHYNICKSKRAQAIKLGAIEVSSRAVAMMRKAARPRR